LSHFSRT